MELIHNNDLPYPVKVIEHLTIPMRDGTLLAAKMWYPESAEDQSLPAIMEYEPYRKRDLLAVRDAMMHAYFAGHGYRVLRVELRGTGESQGILTDEYLPLELQDGWDVIKWISQQPWCSGKVGMIGKSWGGFNSLQLAAMQPEALKAIIPVCFTDDRFADDVHYMGGCLLGDNLSWASTMYAYTALPPDPQLVGEKWRDMWLQRVKESGFWLRQWLSHQTRDEYWRHGSVCEDYQAIQCAVFAVSGWADGYTNAVFRVLKHLQCPRLGLVGPWGHAYPHQGVPGPAIGFLQEALRFWDYWLKGKPTGIMQEPMLRVWMQRCLTPGRFQTQHPGHWLGEQQWPSSNIQWQVLHLQANQLVSQPVAQQSSPSVCSPLTVGLFAGKWCSYDAPPDLPHDQRQEDGGSLIFDSKVIEEPLTVLGAPEVQLHFSVDQPVAMVAVRLSDIAPDGQVTRVTYGLLNLNHHDHHQSAEELVPGKRYEATVALNDVGYVFEKGHQLRLAISTSYWPLAWTPPALTYLTIDTPSSKLILPQRLADQDVDQAISFEPPQAACPMNYQILQPHNVNWWVKRELAQDLSILEVIKNQGTKYFPDYNWQISHTTREQYTIQHNQCDTALGECQTTIRFQRDDWQVTSHTYTQLSCDDQNFYIHAQIDAYENDQRLYSDNLFHTIKRYYL